MPPNTYMTEDLSKETLMIRKELQQQVNKEKEKGNEAYIKNNKLIVIQKDKRKRDNSVSPLKSLHQGPAKPILAPAKLQKTDPFAYMRCRSHSLSEKTTSKAQELLDIGKRGKSQLEQLKEIKTLQIPNPAGHRGAIDHNPPESKRKKQHIYISTLNTRSLKSSESLHELEQALQILKWDIVGLCEIRRSGEKIEDHGDYLLCYKNEIPGQYGVGFIVKAHLKPMIDEFIGVSDRIAVLNIALPGYKQPISLIQVYAPTEVSNIETKDSFYNDLKVTFIFMLTFVV